jgi:hypothetical protein
VGVRGVTGRNVAPSQRGRPRWASVSPVSNVSVWPSSQEGRVSSPGGAPALSLRVQLSGWARRGSERVCRTATLGRRAPGLQAGFSPAPGAARDSTSGRHPNRQMDLSRARIWCGRLPRAMFSRGDCAAAAAQRPRRSFANSLGARKAKHMTLPRSSIVAGCLVVLSTTGLTTEAVCQDDTVPTEVVAVQAHADTGLARAGLARMTLVVRSADKPSQGVNPGVYMVSEARDIRVNVSSSPRFSQDPTVIDSLRAGHHFVHVRSLGYRYARVRVTLMAGCHYTLEVYLPEAPSCQPGCEIGRPRATLTTCRRGA